VLPPAGLNGRSGRRATGPGFAHAFASRGAWGSVPEGSYLLACALDGSSPEPPERLLSLHAAARESATARRELAALLRAPATLDHYARGLAAFRADAHRILTTLGGDTEYTPVLADLVDESSRVLL
jgi:heptaprenyl diphosphate synthase